MRLVVFISGRGTNLSVLLNNQDNFEVAHVISDKAQAKGLQLAQQHNVETTVIPWQNKVQAEKSVLHLLDDINPELIVLAGFMRILSTDFTSQFTNKIINIHPSLLPKYPGLNTHQRALDGHEIEHGASVHFVNSKLDGGQIISQCHLTIQHQDTAETLATRLLSKEHQLLLTTVKHLADNSIHWRNQRLYYNDMPLAKPISWDI